MSFSTWIRLAVHRVVNDCDLGRSSLSHQAEIELCRVIYARDLMRMCVEFRDEILLRGGGGGGECETPENPNFQRNCRMVNFGYKSGIFLDLG